MIYKFYFLQESMTNFQDKKNVCFYHSFYIYIKKYFRDIIPFHTFLQFKNTQDYFTSIKQFTVDYKLLYSFLIQKQPTIKNILDNIVLGIAVLINQDSENSQDSYDLENTDKVELHGFIKLTSLLKNKIHFKNNIKPHEKPIILLNHKEHFSPIMLTK